MEGFIKFITSSKVYLPIIYIVIGFSINFIVSNMVNKIMLRHKSTSGKDKRKDTIINLFKNIFKYLILILIVLEILKLYGVDTSSIIASLGIFAAVIGLAFQDILKDLLAGISIIFDNIFLNFLYSGNFIKKSALFFLFIILLFRILSNVTIMYIVITFLNLLENLYLNLFSKL